MSTRRTLARVRRLPALRVLPALPALLLVAACSGGAPDAAPTTPAPAPATTAPATTAPPEPTTAAPTTPPPLTLTPSSPPPTTPARATAYVFPIAGCRVSYGHAHHDYPATDIFARTGCAVVSPVRGRVDEVTYTDRWDGSTNKGADRGGLSVSIVGVDGVRYYGSHLSRIAPGVKPGLAVEPGTRLGDVGTTGSARGTSSHLHFGISWPTKPGVWWVRRGMVAPWRYLDSWRAGGSLSPAPEVRRARAQAGTDVPPCPGYC
jgi:murein DD-endopeptidase MepM/ murein hydrolase activator NlpD